MQHFLTKYLFAHILDQRLNFAMKFSFSDTLEHVQLSTSTQGGPFLLEIEFTKIENDD